MKRIVLLSLLFFVAGLQSKAQVLIYNDNLSAKRLSNISASVIDSKTEEPIAYASVYVVPAKDTVITNFTMSDEKGQAKLEEVPLGKYVFHVEMLGYKPYAEEVYFRTAEVTLNPVRMVVDDQFLKAAVVSDVGNPIVIKQDTVIFNASSFHVGANAMLKDLLKRMPGIEITADGKVVFNGEEIDKLTVGGRTFFFGDQSVALNNLPAAVVDKIKIIDRESEATRATGVKDGDTEKVLDVALKKEYERGWFGNVGVKGGTTLVPEENGGLTDDRGLLYNSNALVAAYNDKEQVTMLANGQNVDDSGVVIVLTSDEGGVSRSSLEQGLVSAGQFGMNVNSSRIKNVESDGSAVYKYSDMDSRSERVRTTFMDDGDILSEIKDGGRQFVNSVSTELQARKEKGKYWFRINPRFKYNKTDEFSSRSSRIGKNGELLNISENRLVDHGIDKSAGVDGYFTVRDLFGKKSRNLRFRFGGGYGSDMGNREEFTSLSLAGAQEERLTLYDNDATNSWWEGGLEYAEPIGKKWTLSVSATYYNSLDKNTRDASDRAGHVDQLSSYVRQTYSRQDYKALALFSIDKKSWISFGAVLSGSENEVISRYSAGTDTTGRGILSWFITPEMQYVRRDGDDRIQFRAIGFSRRPSAGLMRPMMDVSNPSMLSLGNIYLRPYNDLHVYLNWDRNDKKRFSTLEAGLSGDIVQAPVVYASWYDPEGRMYSIPVNASKPYVNCLFRISYTFPLDSKKIWSLRLSTLTFFNYSTSYQQRSAMAGVSPENLDYHEFMAEFWGNRAGDRFYGGRSGFDEGRTARVNPDARIVLKYNKEPFYFALGSYNRWIFARYSLNPSVNMNTGDYSLWGEIGYTTESRFDFKTELSYKFYTGYDAGYGEPEWLWNAEVTKDVGAFTLSLKIHDILNQTKNLSRTVTANYHEDIHRLVLGRYALVGVKWNFGKMNAAHNRRAQLAAWKLAL
ncbi:MAG: carboxypeptidase-like regulatory domain-containing protein [Bacteroidota bacterium]|nr:carboxypeptidase-like regulatory domain-containing protein [Bacteroidota bacterium]